MVDPRPLDAGSERRRRDEPAVATPNVPAIAVLPFTNLSGDPKQDYFSDGLTEDILTELSRARDLRVIARNTTFQYKGKAVDVGQARARAQCPLRARRQYPAPNDRLRVTAQLIDAKTGTHIWADRYDREMADRLPRPGRDREPDRRQDRRLLRRHRAQRGQVCRAQEPRTKSRLTTSSCGHATRCSGIGPARHSARRGPC